MTTHSTPGTRSTPGALASIDDVLEERCACGCGRALAENGPSRWFATDLCQLRWNEARATDPADVYNRPDAALYPLADSAAQVLRAVRPAPAREPFVVSVDGERREYVYGELSNEDRERVHSWIQAHGLEPRDVPIATNIDIDGLTVLIEVYDRDESGNHFVYRDTDELARLVHRAELVEPWPLPPPVDRQIVVAGFDPASTGPPVWVSTPHFTFEANAIYEWSPSDHSGTVSFDLTREQAERLRGLFDDLTRHLRPLSAAARYAAERFRPLLDETHRFYAEHANLAAEPPSDPMQRALWHRRNRSTGPTSRDRAPRRIDPTRSR